MFAGRHGSNSFIAFARVVIRLGSLYSYFANVEIFILLVSYFVNVEDVIILLGSVIAKIIMLDGSASAVIPLLGSFAITEVSFLLCSSAIAEGIVLGRVAITEAFNVILGTFNITEVFIDIVNSFAINFSEVSITDISIASSGLTTSWWPSCS